MCVCSCVFLADGMVGLWQALEEAERRKKKLARRMERFEELLEDYFYRSDHVGTTWDIAKEKLRGHSAYKDLRRYPDDRLAVFTAHMKKLADACNKVGVAASPAATKKRSRAELESSGATAEQPDAKSRRVES